MGELNSMSKNVYEIITDFEGSSLGEFEMNGDSINAGLRYEPIVSKDGCKHDYNWHFNFGIRNKSNKDITIYLKIGREKEKECKLPGIIFKKNSLHDEFILTQEGAFTDTYGNYSITLKLDAYETAFLSNTYYRNYSILRNLFEDLSNSCIHRREVYGTSIEGRDLVAYCLSEKISKYKPILLITSGFHPMEADTLATESIMRCLLTKEGSSVLDVIDVIIAPMVNPDGFFHGFNGCNANGINLYWDFREKDNKNTPESFYLWEYIKKIKPSIYIDFHAYTFQQHRKKDSPYLKPLYFYDGRLVRNTMVLIEERLKKLHDGYFMSGISVCSPSTLSYKLTNHFNTMTFAKYHLHVSDGKMLFMQKAIDTIKVMAQSCKESKLTFSYDVLNVPFGGVKTRIFDLFRRRFELLWFFMVKPLLKKCLGRQNVV